MSRPEWLTPERTAAAMLVLYLLFGCVYYTQAQGWNIRDTIFFAMGLGNTLLEPENTHLQRPLSASMTHPH